MKHDGRFSLLLALLLAASSAESQTRDAQGALPDNEVSTSITVAHCQYTPADQSCVGANESSHPNGKSEGHDTVAQFPRRTGPPMGLRRPIRYPGSYAPVWTGGDGRHVLIGALVGFGLGAAMGAKGNTDQHPGVAVKAAFIVGTIGGLLGAAIGSSVPSFYARNLRHRAPWPGERHEPDDEDQVASRSYVGKSSGN